MADFCPGLIFFWVDNPRKAKEILATTGILSEAIPLRSLKLALISYFEI